MKFALVFVLCSVLLGEVFAQEKIPEKKETPKKTASTSTKLKKPTKDSVLSIGLDFDPKKLFIRARFKANKVGEQKIFENIVIKNVTKESSLCRMVLYEYHPDEFGVNNVKKSKANVKIPEISLNEYISFPKEAFSLNPGEEKKIPIEITVNKSFVGSKYALFTFEKVNNMVMTGESSKKSAIALELEILGAIIVDIADSGVIKVEQESLGIIKNTIVIDVKNVGDHMLNQPVLEAVLFDSNMVMLDKFSMQPTRINPTFTHKSKRRFIYHLTKKYPKGKYKLYTQFRAESGTFSNGAKFDLEM